MEDPFVAGSGTVLRPDNYREILNVEGVMARIEVPRLNIDLPIYHTTEDDVLNRGVGHLEGSSFPIGGENTHAVLAGHSGLPNRRMFTPLLPSHGGIEYGDIFIIRVFGHSLSYKVDQISTVTPNEVEELRVEKYSDFVTLITCTPYAINSHRLLVRGVRVECQEEELASIVPLSQPLLDSRVLMTISIALVFIMILIIFGRRQKRKLIVEREIELLIEGMY